MDSKTGAWVLSERDVECIAIGAGILGCGGGGSPHIGKLRTLRSIRQGKVIRVMTPERLVVLVNKIWEYWFVIFNNTQHKHFLNNNLLEKSLAMLSENVQTIIIVIKQQFICIYLLNNIHLISVFFFCRMCETMEEGDVVIPIGFMGAPAVVYEKIFNGTEMLTPLEEMINLYKYGQYINGTLISPGNAIRLSNTVYVKY